MMAHQSFLGPCSKSLVLIASRQGMAREAITMRISGHRIFSESVANETTLTFRKPARIVPVI